MLALRRFIVTPAPLVMPVSDDLVITGAGRAATVIQACAGVCALRVMLSR
jgi:hypothetical protein